MKIKLFKNKYIITYPNYLRIGLYISFYLICNKNWKSFKYTFFPSIIKINKKNYAYTHMSGFTHLGDKYFSTS